MGSQRASNRLGDVTSADCIWRRPIGWVRVIIFAQKNDGAIIKLVPRGTEDKKSRGYIDDDDNR
jgi:hypothetical protein